MDELLQTVIEAATWIEKVNPRFEGNFYRSEELRPSLLISPDVFNSNLTYHNAALTGLVTKRREYLRISNIPLLTLEEVSQIGKLVSCNPLNSELDGGAEVYSQGYFDLWDCPLWDTWVAFGTEWLRHCSGQAEAYQIAIRQSVAAPRRWSHHEDVFSAWVPNALLNSVDSGRQAGIGETLFGGICPLPAAIRL